MSPLRKFYFTCPAVPQARVLCQAEAAAGVVAHECLMCGQTHVLDPYSRAVVRTVNDLVETRRSAA